MPNCGELQLSRSESEVSKERRSAEATLVSPSCDVMPTGIMSYEYGMIRYSSYGTVHSTVYRIWYRYRYCALRIY